MYFDYSPSLSTNSSQISPISYAPKFLFSLLLMSLQAKSNKQTKNRKNNNQQNMKPKHANLKKFNKLKIPKQNKMCWGGKMPCPGVWMINTGRLRWKIVIFLSLQLSLANSFSLVRGGTSCSPPPFSELRLCLV